MCEIILNKMQGTASCHRNQHVGSVYDIEVGKEVKNGYANFY